MKLVVSFCTTIYLIPTSRHYDDTTMLLVVDCAYELPTWNALLGGGACALPPRPPLTPFFAWSFSLLSLPPSSNLSPSFYEALPLCKYYFLLVNFYNTVTTAELLSTTVQVHYQVATTVSLFVLTTKYHYLLPLYSLQCITPFCSSMTPLKTISMHVIWQHDFCKRSLHAFFVERNPFWWPKRQRKKGPSECKQITAHE